MIFFGRWLAVGFCVAFWGAVYVLLLLLFAGCATAAAPPPANRVVSYPESDVLFTTPAEVDRLCKLAPNARHDGGIYLGCYLPAWRLAIVPHDDAAVLAHELRHAREGRFHP